MADVKNAKKTGRGAGKPFEKGNKGRPKGALNKATVAHKDWLHAVFESKDYRDMFARKLRSGKLPPNIWQDALNRAYGKPATVIDAGGSLLDLLLAQGRREALTT